MINKRIKMDLADLIAIQSLLDSYVKLMESIDEKDPFMRNMRDSQVYCCEYLIKKIEGKLEKLK